VKANESEKITEFRAPGRYLQGQSLQEYIRGTWQMTVKDYEPEVKYLETRGSMKSPEALEGSQNVRQQATVLSRSQFKGNVSSFQWE
jgi:hypothetical protein